MGEEEIIWKGEIQKLINMDVSPNEKRLQLKKAIDSLMGIKENQGIKMEKELENYMEKLVATSKIENIYTLD